MISFARYERVPFRWVQTTFVVVVLGVLFAVDQQVALDAYYALVVILIDRNDIASVVPAHVDYELSVVELGPFVWRSEFDVPWILHFVSAPICLVDLC